MPIKKGHAWAWKLGALPSVVVGSIGHFSTREHKMVCFASSALQGAPSRLGGVAIPLFRLCVPPPPQLTLQAVHAVQGPQTQSNGFASAKGKEAKKIVSHEVSSTH